jgi:hypothetical protein
MKPRILAAAVAIAAVSVLVRADVATGLVDPYLRIQTALANDSLQPVKSDAGLIAAEAAKLGDPAKVLRTTASELAAASNIEAARTAFGRLSDALIKYADDTHTSLGSEMRVAFCPMVNKSWVQKGTKIANPYYGKSMLTCGEIVKTLK